VAVRGLAALLLLAAPAAAGEVVRLSAETWRLVPGGKEVDAVAGDFVLRNDRVVAVVGGVAKHRHANLSCKSVQGALIDFTLLASNNDQLTAFYPHGDRNGAGAAVDEAEIVAATGPEVVLRFRRAPTEAEPLETVTEYSLRDGESHLKVVTRRRNPGARAAAVRVSDKMRCDQTFEQSAEGQHEALFFHDRWFGAAYAVVRRGGRFQTPGKSGGMFGLASGTWIDYPEHVRDPRGRTALVPADGELVLTRYLVAARHLAEAQAAVRDLLGLPHKHLEVFVLGPDQRPVPGAEVSLRQGAREVSLAFTDESGRAEFSVPEGRYSVEVSQTGRTRTASVVDVPRDPALRVSVGPRSQVDFDVRDGEGRPIPSKVQFLPVEDTPALNLGPKQRADGCLNLWFSPTGRFSVPLPPGKYYLIVSRGPEHDAAYRYISLREGETEAVAVRLPRVVDTRGWISADFHNHSTPSGDNTTDLDGRLVCLAAEHVEFAPATEHNRIVSYSPRIAALGIGRYLSSSDGIEVTGNPLPIAHLNAFPVVLREREQDQGGPPTGPDPLAQIRRLFDHDAGAEKLVQQNHPDIGWLVYDADGDGVADQGFGTFKFTHVIEAWGADILEFKPLRATGVAVRNNTIFNWLQLLNQGFRLPAAANTDAHYCNHESGRIRNWVKSPTDEPAEIRELDVVRAAKAGRMVMSNGPYLEASLEGKGPGETLERGGRALLRVRVQAANWLDVDRVQVLVNGRARRELNRTRSANPELFRDGPLKFEGEFAMEFAADAHVIVVAVGEASTTGPVMGQSPERPCAIANPIWVDADGGGIAPNRDTLDAPLPVKRSPAR
jgi:hypothetical protein